MTPTVYYAYGSNLDVEGMEHRAPGSVKLGPAYLYGWRLTFRGVADIERGSRWEMTPGGLWLLDEQGEANIDRYEGVPYAYRRERVDVWWKGRRIRALTYVMTGADQVGLPSPYYFESIARGYRDFGLKPKYLARAVERVHAEHERRGVKSYYERGPKRMMAIVPRKRKKNPEPDWSGMSPATRRLEELERGVIYGRRIA